MAYIFNSVNQQLEDQKANIFNNQPQQQGGGGGSSGGTVNKTSTEGSVGGGSAPSQKPAQQPQSTAKSQASFQKAASKAKTPEGIQQLAPKLQAAQQNVQQEANQYAEAAKNKSFNLEQSALEKAAEGDQEAMGQVGGRLAQKQVEQAQAFDPKTQYQFQEIQDIQSDPGIKQMYRRQVGPQYGRGESAFDAMLLQKNPEFQKLRNQLFQTQQGLNQEVGKTKEEKSAEAQKAYEENFARDTGDIRKRLGGIGEGELTAAQKMADEINARRAGIDVGSIAAEEERQAAQELMREMAAGGTSLIGRSAKYLSDQDLLNQINEADYIKRHADLSNMDVLSQGQADKYNRVMSLLGENKSLQAGAGPGEDIERNIGGLRQQLQQAAMTKRANLDAAQEAKLRQLKGQLEGQRGQMALTRDEAIRQQRNAALEDLMREFTGGGPIQSYQDILAGGTRESKLSPEQRAALDYYRNDQTLADPYFASSYGAAGDWKDVVNQEQANQFNQIYEDLGLSEKIGVGGGLKNQFDVEKFKQAVRSRSQGMGEGNVNKRYSPTDYITDPNRANRETISAISGGRW